MIYVSSSGASKVSLREAMANCFAPDGSLYMPERLPVLPRAYFNNIQEMSLTEIAYVVANTLLGDDIESSKLKAIVESSFNFPIPLVSFGDNTYLLELFNGPTLAFKDIGARFFASILREINVGRRTKVVLSATTGNTGGAVANAFAGVDDVVVLVLYPKGILSRSQLAQFTTVGRNVIPLEIAGTMAQCKKMVREAAEDKSMADVVMPLIANSQNIIRVLPQIVYFFYAYAQLRSLGVNADGFRVAIPCGNLSNLTAALMAKRMGLPLGRIVAACNANDDIVRVLSGDISLDKVNISSRPTLAHAMDTGYPTNLPRIMRMYDNDLDKLRKDVAAYSISDDEIAATIIETQNAKEYMCDPHTAVALRASYYDREYSNPIVVMATAHPAKSLDTMTEITGRAVELPLQLTRFMSRQTASTKLPPTYAALKRYILTNI